MIQLNANRDDALRMRRHILATLDHVILQRQRLSNLEIPEDLTAIERAVSGRITGQILRHISGLDVLIDGMIHGPITLAARQILRLIAAEILINQSPAHHCVQTGVDLAGSRYKTRKVKGLINALGRRIAEEGPGLWPELAQLPAPMPKNLSGPIIRQWGKDVLAMIQKAHLSEPQIDLTLRETIGPDLEAKLEASMLPSGSYRLSGRPQISALPGYLEGAWWVQDAAAALPARILDAQKDETILDLCAAPGGKTMQLAATGARVEAVDSSSDRLLRLRANLTRTKLAAQVTQADLTRWAPENPVDKILLDAPCSATGTIRRHPDLPFVADLEDLRPLLHLQQTLLRRAFEWLKPGGRLVYATCSLLPSEGEKQVKGFLKNTKNSIQIPLIPQEYGLPDSASAEGGALRTRPDFWPDLGGMDGFYIALIERRA